MKNALVNLVNISKSFDNQMVLDDLNLYIRENEFLTLLGPSGCGKTTTLRILGGFETPDKGQVIFEGRDITNLPPNKRNLNTVFQKYALFPHMTIAENIAFGLKISGKSKSYINDKIKYALKLVNLDGFENRMPDSLSGGQQQRIAIARAIVNEPMNQGYIQQIGTPESIYNEPENAFVADFIGDSNIIGATMIRDRLVEILGARFDCVDTGFGENKPVDVVIRPEDVELVAPEEGIIQGTLTHSIFKGVHYEMEVMANGFEWLVQSTKMVPVGTKVGIKVDPFNIQIMKKPESEDEEAIGVNE